MWANPFGTVPAAFSPDGTIGIFESNGIMRAVARLSESRFPLYGRDPFEASRIDSFLDASLLFARVSRIYLLSLMSGNGIARDILNLMPALTMLAISISTANRKYSECYQQFKLGNQATRNCTDLGCLVRGCGVLVL